MDATNLIQSGIAGLIEGKNLTRTEARDIMGAIMLGDVFTSANRFTTDRFTN